MLNIRLKVGSELRATCNVPWDWTSMCYEIAIFYTSQGSPEVEGFSKKYTSLTPSVYLIQNKKALSQNFS